HQRVVHPLRRSRPETEQATHALCSSYSVDATFAAGRAPPTATVLDAGNQHRLPGVPGAMGVLPSGGRRQSGKALFRPRVSWEARGGTFLQHRAALSDRRTMRPARTTVWTWVVPTWATR